MRFRISILATLALAVPLSSSSQVKQVPPPPPPPPPQSVPDLRESKVTVQCVGCDKRFDTENHAKLLEGLVGNDYTAELRKALYFQDSIHQFESKAHFDNCDFDSAVAYIDALLKEAGGHVVKAEMEEKNGRATEGRNSAKAAFFVIGQALHAVQDFYAHSNYIELKEVGAKDATDIPVVAVWTSKGKDELKKLQENGLISGYVFWGSPQKCKPGSKSHSDLAKDSESTTSGKVRVAHLENLSQFRLATVAARQASADFMDHVFKTWPTLKRLNKNYVAYEIFVDRRGL